MGLGFSIFLLPEQRLRLFSFGLGLSSSASMVSASGYGPQSLGVVGGLKDLAGLGAEGQLKCGFRV